MRIGNRLGGLLVWALAATTSVAAGAQTTERVTTVPLGGTSDGQTGDHAFGVYVPTRFGGELTIKASAGKVVDLRGPDGAPRTNGQDIGADRHGWYTFKLQGAGKPYTVQTTFVQVGQSIKRPWNFYYWPTKGDSIHEPWAGGNARVDTMNTAGDDVLRAAPGSYIPPGVDIVLPGANGMLETQPSPGDEATWFPNLYDDLFWLGPDKEHAGRLTQFMTPAPLLKYDQLFNSGARAYEAMLAQNNDISRWPGHCLGGAVASILMNDPQPAPGSGLTQDELKALWAELGENHLNHRIGDYATDIPPGPPRPGPDECDWKVPRVHAVLETHIRGRRQALLANLRAFPPRGTPHEVWNHAVFKYVASYHAIPGRGPRAVRIVLELHANSGSCLNGQDNKDRVIYYEYSLVYGLDGQVDETNPYAADWIRVAGEGQFAPLNILELAESRWAGHNPYVTEANVRAIDLANGGGVLARFGSKPPQFRTVAEYEGTRPSVPMVAGGMGEPIPPPGYGYSYGGGGGFFRRVFGR